MKGHPHRSQAGWYSQLRLLKSFPARVENAGGGTPAAAVEKEEGQVAVVLNAGG